MKHFQLTAGFLAAAIMMHVSTARVDAADPTLRQLHALEDLSAAFNRDAGVPRVVLLLSPT